MTMTDIQRMKAASKLNSHQGTLGREVSDLRMLIGNIEKRLLDIQTLIAGDAQLAAMWGAVLNGEGEGEAITPADLASLLADATKLVATVERINDKQPVFWVKAGSAKEESAPIDATVKG